jgi:CHAT domain-containing protein/tetratricopeptide (TPR) repeat protein
MKGDDVSMEDGKSPGGPLAEVEHLKVEFEELLRQGRLEETFQLVESLLAIHEKALGPEHPEVSPWLNRLANVWLFRGDYARAAPLIQRSLAIQEKVFGPEHPDLASLIQSLALLYVGMGQHARAEPLLRRALAVQEKAFGPEHPRVARVLGQLALQYRYTGHYEQAEPLFQRAVTILENALGPDHRDVAPLIQNLAGVYIFREEHARAEPLLQRALIILEKALGPEHLDVGNVLNDLAELYRKTGEYSRAEPLYLRALSIAQKALGPGHPRVAQSIYNLGHLYGDKGDYERAASLAERALVIREKMLGPEHPHVALSLNSLAVLYERMGDYVRPEPLYLRALDIQEKSLGPEHDDVAKSLNNLSVHFLKRGDFVRAQSFAERSLAIREKVLPSEHPSLAMSLTNLAMSCKSSGNHAHAEALSLRAVTILEKALGPGHPKLASSLNNLAQLHAARGDGAGAEALHLRVLAIREHALGPRHPQVATSLHNLGLLYEMRGDASRAESLYRRALAIRERALGPEHPHVARSLSSLGWLQVNRGDILTGIRTFERTAAIEDRNATAMMAIGSDEQKRIYMAMISHRIEEDVSLHVQAAPGDQTAKRLALTRILRHKGRVLDAMADSFAAMRRRLGSEEKALLDQLRSLSAEQSALTWRGPQGMPLDVYRTSLAQLDDERQRLEAELGRRSADVQAALEPVTIEQVQGAIPQGAALVELFRYRPFHSLVPAASEMSPMPRYVAYLLRSQGDIAWVDLGTAAPIEAAVDRLRRALARPAESPRPAARDLDAPAQSIADLQPAARELDGLVMQPIRQLLGSTCQILLSPDGVLNLVPFGALVDESGRYLIERCAFTYLASGRDLVRLGTSAPSRQGPVIIAAPDFNAAATPALPAEGDDRTRPSATLRATWFQPLRFAAEEGRAVARRLPGSELLMGAAATKSAVTKLGGPLLFHIATHGFFLPDQPARFAPSSEEFDTSLLRLGEWVRPTLPIDNPLLRSGLALSGANRGHRGREDGVLTALEVSQLDLAGTKLVVLSACETGLGEVRGGDGVYGLRRAMVMAGAEAQVMSLWSVDDAATCELMVAYYDKLLAGGGRGEALRQAQIEMLGRLDRAHPYYWASFIVSGNGAALDGTW